jgi:predicted phosphodiesterase
MLRFIVIADSHIRPEDQEVDAYPSNALLLRRNEAVVDLCNSIDAAFVVHLGDIVHPLPVEDSHETAISLAQEVYSRLRHPIHFVAGNHDVGDKPDAHVAVPAVAEENYPVFESSWGPSFSSFDEGDCHFVIVDAQVINSGFEREERQREWLEADLASASGQRIFLFMHYPPFIREREEGEHYDNIAEPGRSWLLGLCDRFLVEGLFAGHVHNFLYNRSGPTQLYVAPSTGFVRPDYAELAAIPPAAENGRDDPPKLGIFVVDVTEDGHTVTPIRTHGCPVSVDVLLDPGWSSPVGVTIRHGWMSVVDLPADGLDEFNRKRVRNDASILSLWEARIRDVRIPLADLEAPGAIQRLRDLTSRGARFSVYSAGVPDEHLVQVVAGSAPWLARWEIIVEPDRMAEAVRVIPEVGVGAVRVALAPIVPVGSDTRAVHHFVAAGWRTDAELSRIGLADPMGTIDDLVFHIADGLDVEAGVREAVHGAREVGRGAVVIIELPRASESVAFTDDGAVGDRVVDAVRAAKANPEAVVYLDGFMDHDRGYYPRHGLINRAYNPRRALYRLVEAASDND